MPLTVINARRPDAPDRPTGIRIDAGAIVELGTDVGPEPSDQVIDAGGKYLMEPLVNGHTHAAMTLFRGYGSDLQLMDWLQNYIWPAEARLTDEQVYWGTRLAALEMIRCGTTHYFDMYWRPGAVAQATVDAGIRATLGGPLFDGGDETKLAEVQAMGRECLDAIEAHPGYGSLISASLTPHATYTVSGRSLEWAALFAEEREIPVHIHFCETISEVEEFRAANPGLSPTEYLDQRGLLHPKVLLAHACVMDRADYELIAERGATVVTNPSSNLKLASGRIFPYRRAAEAGVHIGLGTDGASSNNSLDLLAELKTFALLQKHESYDATTLPAPEALAIAQGRRSPLLGGQELAVGGRADFLLIDTDLPQMTPGDVVDNLVYSGAGESVDTVVVAGRVLMQNRSVLPGADGSTASDVLGNARRCAVDLLGTSTA